MPLCGNFAKAKLFNRVNHKDLVIAELRSLCYHNLHMKNALLDEKILSKVMERIMFESVEQGVDISDPKEKRDFVNQIVEKILGQDHPQQRQYEETIISDMYREETLDKTGSEGYQQRMKGARANEYRNLDATRK